MAGAVDERDMSIVDTLKKLLLQPPATRPRETSLVYVYLPEAIEPDIRFSRYESPLEAELQLSGLGWVSGGGSLLSAELPDGSQEILHVGVDVDALDVSRVRELLRINLPELGCPAGTRLLYEEQGRDLQDEFDGRQWNLAQSQPAATPD
jgi:hypothetical protein